MRVRPDDDGVGAEVYRRQDYPVLVSMAQRLPRDKDVMWWHGEMACTRVAVPRVFRPHAPRWHALARRLSHIGKVSQVVSI
jgi:hypothetical protein